MTTVENTVNPRVTPDEALARPTREEFLAQTEAAQRAANETQASITQREWLLIRRALDCDRVEVLQDGGLRMVALAWVKAKRNHGGASWDMFLNMTDDEVLALNGFPTVLPDDDEGLDLGDPGESVVTITEEEAKAKAEFCLRLQVAPSEYDGLSDIERAAFKAEAERIIEERRNEVGA